jgi:xylan 1,4-beta-xylosidase
MQLMSWMLARLGSRFGLLFEPHMQRVRHSSLGRFFDQPMDLMVGFVEPDGTERVMPFTSQGQELFNCEQFERLNSITFRGYSERYNLRFEFNVHSVFYPQNVELCTTPAFYLEMRVHPINSVRLLQPRGKTPSNVKLFLRLGREETEITASVPSEVIENDAGQRQNNGQIDLAYTSGLTPKLDATGGAILGRTLPEDDRVVQVKERIVSLNPGCQVDEDGKGLTLEIPVTEPGSGVKWRLVWGSHVKEPVLNVKQGKQQRLGRLKYVDRLPDIDAVMDDAITARDRRLAQSRRFEKLFDQASLTATQRHLINQSFQSFLSNTWWCRLNRGDGTDPRLTDKDEWFSVMEGSSFFHSTLDDEYNCSMFYLSLWPGLLDMQLNQWPHLQKSHEESGGVFLCHDMGRAVQVAEQAYDHDMPVEENCNYVLLMQVYAHWTGDLTVVERHADLIERIGKYLIWADRDGSGFPSEGTPNTLDDASPATEVARKQTYMAVKRLAALQAVSDLLDRVGKEEAARNAAQEVEKATPLIEQAAWLGDHYAVCVDRTSTGITNAKTGQAIPYDEIPGWDAYSIYTGNGLLLPLMAGQPALLDTKRLADDLYNATRETLSPYGCGHSSIETDNVWVSQNLWRDHLGQYIGLSWPHFLAQRYWDLQVMSNTHRQTLGFTDTYIGNNLSFFPRGVTSIGYLLAHPRLVIDRLHPRGQKISINPDRHINQRWPLLSLADWTAGKIPICVVDTAGNVTVESPTDPVTIQGNDIDPNMIG